MAEPDDEIKIPKKLNADESRRLYVECLGQLVGVTFKPETKLKKVLEVSKQEYDLAQAEPDPLIIRNISTVNSKNWQPGALSSCLKRFGYDPTGKKVKCADPLHPTAEEILPSLEFPQPRQINDPDTSSSSKRNADVLNGKSGLDEIQNDRKKLRQDPTVPNPQSWKNLDTFKRPDPKNTFYQIQLPGNKNSSRGDSENDLGVNTSLFTSITSKDNKDKNFATRNPPSSSVVNNVERDEENNGLPSGFQTATTLLMIQDKAKGIKRDWTSNNPNPNEQRSVRAPGLYKPDIVKARNNFARDIKQSENEKKQQGPDKIEINGDEPNLKDLDPETLELLQHPQLKNFDPKLVVSILSEVMQPPQATKWEDIAGLLEPKKIINEVIIWPMLRPEIFNGLRAPAKGILLFGPPGTGKTMIGRVIASVSKSTFFNISASSLTSKWIGEGEKLVRCLFQLARIKQPSVVFIDEIDSILTARSDTEHESSRRMKTEFLVQFDGAGTTSEDRVLVIGVTNRPQELDEAARRRLVKRIYIPLPDIDGRIQIVKNLMKDQRAKLSQDDYYNIGRESAGFSGADMKSLCQDASYGPIREIMDELETITPERVRDIEFKDFEQAFKHVKSSVADTDLSIYEEWDFKFGSHARQ